MFIQKGSSKLSSYKKVRSIPSPVWRIQQQFQRLSKCCYCSGLWVWDIKVNDYLQLKVKQDDKTDGAALSHFRLKREAAAKRSIFFKHACSDYKYD
ncbi:hypothetical protein O9993_07055 [Vibrio lentus]|nr:hypothetical protein [Vibrio lentus]